MLDAKGEGNFVARLFVDAESHLPIMITYMERDCAHDARVQRGAANDREQRARAVEEERKRREAEGRDPPMVENSWFLADYKKVDGVKLPHRFTRSSVGDKPSRSGRSRSSR